MVWSVLILCKYPPSTLRPKLHHKKHEPRQLNQVELCHVVDNEFPSQHINFKTEICGLSVRYFPGRSLLWLIFHWPFLTRCFFFLFLVPHRAVQSHCESLVKISFLSAPREQTTPCAVSTAIKTIWFTASSNHIPFIKTKLKKTIH